MPTCNKFLAMKDANRSAAVPPVNVKVTDVLQRQRGGRLPRTPPAQPARGPRRNGQATRRPLMEDAAGGCRHRRRAVRQPSYL